MKRPDRLPFFTRAAALGLAFTSFACSAGVTSATGGGGGDGAGGDPGAGGGSTTGAGGGIQDGGVDAPPDGPPGACTMASDCSALNDLCTTGTCINGACAASPANEFGACDDGNFCTQNDLCQAGACVGGSATQCAPPDACHVGVCDEAADACMFPGGNDGAQCDDEDACTGAGVCSNGVCSTGNQIDCSVYDNQCTVGVCDPAVGCKAQPSNEGGGCLDGMNSPCSTGVCLTGQCISVPANEGGGCDDNLFCTVNDHCVSAVCVSGGPNPCAPPGGCFIASCDENNNTCTAVPGNDGAACDDFSVCTTSTTCLAGACINGSPANEGALCDDGTDCTSGEFCSSGLCGGGSGPPVYFSEDFADNAAGWQLGPEWQIGAAQASNGGVFGADPATDYTPSLDNGVAGVVIGGNASTNLHDFYYLESPTFNTAAAVGPVILGFRRWLNSDYDPFMHNNVQVWDGGAWVEIWNSGPAPGVEDSPPNGLGWTFIQHDLTAYKGAAMRVRFGFDIGSMGVYTIGSWNIDDVLVAGAACP